MPITREFFVYLIWDSWYDLWVINCLFGGVLLPFLLPFTRIPFPETPMSRLVEMTNAAIPSHGVTGVLVVAFVFCVSGLLWFIPVKWILKTNSDLINEADHFLDFIIRYFRKKKQSVERIVSVMILVVGVWMMLLHVAGAIMNFYWISHLLMENNTKWISVLSEMTNGAEALVLATSFLLIHSVVGWISSRSTIAYSYWKRYAWTGDF